MATSSVSKGRRKKAAPPVRPAAEGRIKLHRLQQSISARKGLLVAGQDFTAVLRADGRVLYTGADRWGQGDAAAWTDVTAIAGWSDRLVGISADGSVFCAGRKSPWDHELTGLSCVRRMSCGQAHTAALLANGRVTVVGDDRRGQCRTEDWSSVTDVVCGADFTLGLTEEGTVLVVGGSRTMRYLVRSWRQVAGVFTDSEGRTVYAVTVEGLLLATGPVPRRGWKNLVFVAGCGRRLWGVTAAGRLVTNDGSRRELNENMTHFAACAVGGGHAAVLSRNGRVQACGDNAYGQCDTRRFGALFDSFDEFNSDRRLRDRRMEENAQAYQVRMSEAVRYGGRVVCGPRMTACMTADGRVLSSAGRGDFKQWSHVCALAAGSAHLLALHTDGCVSAEGNHTDGCCDVGDWTRVKAIAAGKYHSLGLTYEGRALFCGRNECGQGDVGEWRNLTALAAAESYTLGVDREGRLLLAGIPPFRKEVLESFPANPVKVVATATHVAALYADGTVRTTLAASVGDRSGDGAAWDTGGWRNVRAIAAGAGFTLGLCYGGRMLAAGRNDCGQCNVASWRDVVAVSCGDRYTAGLTTGGELLLAGQVSADSGLLPAWKDILTFSCGPSHLAAVNREGQVLAFGSDSDGQCTTTTHFTLFRDVRQLYGYGQYRRQTEDAVGGEDLSAEAETAVDTAVVPIRDFSVFAAHLRADSEAISARLSGSERHLSLLDETGKVTMYLYEDGRILTATPASVPARVRALHESTVWVCEDGTARLWEPIKGHAEPTALPDRLGENVRHPVLDVAAGRVHRVILLGDGTLRAYGDNDRGQGDVGFWRGISAVAAGSYHTVGLRRDGTVLATGSSRRDTGGQGRRLARLSRANPCAVEGWENVNRIACAADVTLGLCADGTVLATGNNNFGQCQTDAWRGAVSAVTSGNHTVALFADGSVRAVGHNGCGECRVESWERVVQIAVMPELTLGLTADGRVLAAGRHHPVLETLSDVRAMACFGTGRQIFVKTDGTLWLHNRGSDRAPEAVSGLRLFTPTVENSLLRRYAGNTHSLAARTAAAGFGVGMAHTVYLGDRGVITATGSNDYGQGDVSARGGAVALGAGLYHSAAILADGSIALTGRNTHGQCDARALNGELGTVEATAEGSRSASSLAGADPDYTRLPYAWSRVVCGYEHTAAIRSDGRVYAVGDHADGRCDTRQWRGVIDLACGVRHTVAVLEDGTCVAAGDDRYGQCAVGHWQNVVQVAAGEFHTVARLADGRVLGVGDDRRGQCRLEDLRDVIFVACLPEATLCVHANGHVTLRGGSGEIDGAVSRLTGVVALSACEYRVAALTVDRRLILLPEREG